MGLKAKLDSLDGLAEAIAALYTKRGNHYVLDLEDDDPDGAAALRRAKDHEAGLHKKTKDQLKQATDSLAELQAKLDELEAGKAKGSGDVAALEASYKAKLDKAKADAQARIDALVGGITRNLVDAEATKLASSISKAPSLLMPHIKGRLVAEEVDGQFVVKVLDAAGKPSALTVEDLKQEMLANTEFAPILTASRGSGGGAAGSGGGSGGTGLKQYIGQDGKILWGKVAADAKDNPNLLEQVKAHQAGA